MTNHQIVSVFDKSLGRAARDLANIMPSARIIDVGSFPKGAPIHEDGSSRYDPRKPLVLFAIELRSKRAIKAWDRITRAHDRRVKEANQ